MQVYIRKLFKQDVEKQISFTKEIAVNFFDATSSFLSRSSNMSINAFVIGYESAIFTLSLQSATDYRFSTNLQTSVAAKCGAFAIGDLLYVEKFGSGASAKYGLKRIAATDPAYATLSPMLNATDRHLLLSDGMAMGASTTNPLDEFHVVGSDNAISRFAKLVFEELYKFDSFKAFASILTLASSRYRIEDRDSVCLTGVFNEKANVDGTASEGHYYRDFAYTINGTDCYLVHDWYQSKEADDASASTGRYFGMLQEFVAKYYKNFFITLVGAKYYLYWIPDFPLQEIYYGAPGTGKSYSIDYKLKKARIPKTNVFRVTFHEDYSYSEFVGGLRPQSNAGSISYEYVGGPFAEALKCSFTAPTFLIIEEINRGNPAAIFGDIFQLLDRVASGRSKYTITNKELYEFVCNNPDAASVLGSNSVFLPSNLHILCTMNTADQNVFVLDSAFKRRFRMKYVPIDFTIFSDPSLASYAEETEVFKRPSFKPLCDLLKDTDVADLVSADSLRNWATFATLVNAKIDLLNNSDGDQISEDKKLGPFFVDSEELIDEKKFTDKVLYYLKQDVFKYAETMMTESYQKIYADYALNKKDPFSIFLPSE